MEDVNEWSNLAWLCDIKFNENCFSYNTLTSANPMEKDQSLTAYEIVLHDHNYENTLQNTKKNLDNLKRKLVSIVKENKALKQRVGRLRKRVETFIGRSKRPKIKKIFTRFYVILLSAHEDASLKLFNRMLRNKNSRGKVIQDKYPPCSPVFSAVEFCKLLQILHLCYNRVGSTWIPERRSMQMKLQQN